MRADNKLHKIEVNATELDQVNQKKDEDISEKYRFTLLREEAVERDSFEDGTHEKIATTMYKLITKEKGGVTVGLEGVWGSGKSAIISILGRKLKNEKKIHFFTFDAWAHEGDPLRRIFLESLIESFSTKNKNLEELQSKIAKRLKTITTTSNRSGTGLGVWLAIATLFVPIGMILLTKINFGNLTIVLGEKIYWLFLISTFMISAPILVLVGNLFYLLTKKKKILSTKNWAFMKGVSTEDIKQEVSEDDERSSIEFENYFKQIMAMSLDDDPDKRLVMVIDNLDRIDSEDSLKIWSTLQTFLQQRNMPTNTKSWFEKIWIIVPYDPDGLAKIWDKNEEYKERKNEDVENEGGKAHIFFDKCFQLKFEVPKPILTTWHSFARQKISEALGGWDTNEQEDVLSILKLTRKNLNDIPTPRQIKNYINQVGLMRMHSSHEIPTRLIAYYVVLRLLQQQSVHGIRGKLINGELPESNINRFLSETSSRDMAGLTFGVSPNKGQQLLLEPEIEEALQLGDGGNLRELQEKQLDGFWVVFNHHIQNRSLELKNLLHYSKAIYEGLWEKFKSKLHNYSKIAQHMVYHHEEFEWPDENTIYYYSCVSAILNSPSFGKHLYKLLVASLDLKIDSDDKYDMNIALNILQQLVKAFNINKQSKLSSLVYIKFVLLAQASAKSGIPAWKWIVPDQSLATEISNNISQGTAIPVGLKDAFEYLVKAKTSEEWQGLLTACHNHIQHNNGTVSGESHSPEVIEILFILAFNYDTYDEEIKGIVHEGEFFNLCWDFHPEHMPKIALLCGKYIGKDLNQFSPDIGHAAEFTEILRKYWNNREETTARTLLELLKKYNEWSFLWELAEDSNNKLVVDIILLALQDEKVVKLFEVEAGLQKIKIYFKMFGDDDIESGDLFIRALIMYSSLEKEVISDTELNVIDYSRELFHLITTSDNEELIATIAGKIKELPKDSWSAALNDDNYLTDLAISAQEKSKNFCLSNNYADAFIVFVKDNAEDISRLSEWQKDNWQKLASLMSEEFRTRFKYDWTKFLIEKHSVIVDEMIKLNSAYCDYTQIIRNIDTVQDVLRNAIDSKNFDRLKWLNESVLPTENGKKFKPKKYFPRTIKTPLKSLFQEQKEDSENANLIKELASKFQVKLIETPRESENDKLVGILINAKWLLFYNPDKAPDTSKVMSFEKEGIISEGKNDNESSWRIRNGFLELVDSAGKVQNRFKYDAKNNRFNDTNDSDTGSIIKHSIQNQYMILENSGQEK